MICCAMRAGAQVTNVSLQASGLTCSLCSKSVLSALQKVSFVDKVDVNIKDQQYLLSFKPGAAISFDALEKAVEDAGFSVAVFKVTAHFDYAALRKDEHLSIGDLSVHFLNASGQSLNGNASFTIVDKGYTSAKNFRKYSALTKMDCVQTGYAASCCDRKKAQRIYHAII